MGPRSKEGEIIVLYENGISPVKRPHPNFWEIPKFYPRHNPVRQATVQVVSTPGDQKSEATTEVLHNIESTAIENLDEKFAGILAKKLAGVVLKEGIAYQIEKSTGSPFLGLAFKLWAYISDQADIRSWNLLPRDLQIARMKVTPGLYSVTLNPQGDSIRGTREKTVEVAAGKKVFVAFRYIPGSF